MIGNASVIRTAAMLVAALLAAAAPRAQETHWPEPRQSAAPVDARFEVVPAHGVGQAYRIDKETGRTWVLKYVSSLSSSKPTWTSITPPPDIEDLPRGSAVNFQLLYYDRTNTTFLLHVHSGHSWVLRIRRSVPEWETIAVDR